VFVDLSPILTAHHQANATAADDAGNDNTPSDSHYDSNAHVNRLADANQHLGGARNTDGRAYHGDPASHDGYPLANTSSSHHRDASNRGTYYDGYACGGDS
jgi:hypothetical protein